MGIDLQAQTTIFNYVADGVTSEYPITCYILKPSTDIQVYVNESGSDISPGYGLQVFDSDYSYTPNGDPTTGGTITFLPGHIPASGYYITISRDTAPSINVQFSNVQTFNGNTLDNAFAREMIIIQQVYTWMLQRNLSYIINADLPSDFVTAQTQLPVLRNNQIWKGTGEAVIGVTLEENPDVSTLRSELEMATSLFSGSEIVGYWDGSASNVKDKLDALTTEVEQVQTDLTDYEDVISSQTSGDPGSSHVGHYDSVRSVATTVQAELNLLSGGTIQVAKATTATSAVLNGTIPDDNTKPQITEGVQIFSIPFTAKLSTSSIKITLYIGLIEYTQNLGIAIFDTGTSATDAVSATFAISTSIDSSMTTYVSSGSTSPRTISVRLGNSDASNIYFLRRISTNVYGGSINATLIIEEII